jgi:hypothetical protein
MVPPGSLGLLALVAAIGGPLLANLGWQGRIADRVVRSLPPLLEQAAERAAERAAPIREPLACPAAPPVPTPSCPKAPVCDRCPDCVCGNLTTTAPAEEAAVDPYWVVGAGAVSVLHAAVVTLQAVRGLFVRHGPARGGHVARPVGRPGVPRGVVA